MKRAKKEAAKKAAKAVAKAAEAPPEKLYRPFEKLAKDARDAKKEAARKEREAKEAPAHAVDTKVRGAAGKTPLPRAPSSKSVTSKGPTTVVYTSAAAKVSAERAEHGHAQADAESFAIYMAGVRTLEDKATRIPRSASRVERAAKGTLPTIDADAPARAELAALIVEGIRFETSDDGERIEGRRIEVEPREIRRLRRGQYTVDQQLDLHGMSTHDARRAIETFLDKRRKEGDRVLRIIHGKGTHSSRGVSVLRGELAAWLSQGPAKRHVAAFATAPDSEGGAGCLLVLLMRRS